MERAEIVKRLADTPLSRPRPTAENLETATAVMDTYDMQLIQRIAKELREAGYLEASLFVDMGGPLGLELFFGEDA